MIFKNVFLDLIFCIASRAKLCFVSVRFFSCPNFDLPQIVFKFFQIVALILLISNRKNEKFMENVSDF